MRAFITGISGFVGPYLTDLLISHDFKISGTYLLPGELDNLKPYINKIDLYQCDITNQDELKVIFQKDSFNFVFHLAAQSSVQQSFTSPQKTFRINVLGTINLLETIGEFSQPKMILYTSSADVYGVVDQNRLPLRETTPVNPSSPYAISKVAAEMLCLQYAKHYHVPIIVTRAFNHTGPKQTPQFVIPNFAKQIAEIEAGKCERKLRVGDLTPERDFLDVRDVVNAYLLLAEQGVPGEIYNIASGSAYSIQSILDKMLGLSDLEIAVEVDESKSRPTDDPILTGDYTKLHKTTGWKPKIDIAETLKYVLDYWREMIFDETVKSC